MTNSNNSWKTNGQNTHKGSTNQGTYEAQKGYPASRQQSGESSISYQTRMNAYNTSKS
ncbi:hypothetical protein [Yoonia sp. I 8.24]|uniref:hypothetical protein n=1 Tax=Yoonia sp. I 8.24 TaxID=1537229 RepID=UPI001EDEAC1C|nr:hypothetical protein [Yoonia sp. I 8.24]MCG3267164.1 hypothetical protein [Yoonia sp. I 8.24]